VWANCSASEHCSSNQITFKSPQYARLEVAHVTRFHPWVQGHRSTRAAHRWVDRRLRCAVREPHSSGRSDLIATSPLLARLSQQRGCYVPAYPKADCLIIWRYIVQIWLVWKADWTRGLVFKVPDYDAEIRGFRMLSFEIYIFKNFLAIDSSRSLLRHNGHRICGLASPRQPQPRQGVSRQSSGLPACPHTMLSSMRRCVFLDLRLSRLSSTPPRVLVLSHSFQFPPPGPHPPPSSTSEHSRRTAQHSSSTCHRPATHPRPIKLRACPPLASAVSVRLLFSRRPTLSPCSHTHPPPTHRSSAPPAPLVVILFQA